VIVKSTRNEKIGRTGSYGKEVQDVERG
jgi:hypothetical protein